MTSIRGTLVTENAERHIAQLCDHLEKLTDRGHGDGNHGGGQGGPPLTALERTPEGARLHFTFGECVLEAERTRILIRISADVDRDVAMAQLMIAQRLESFAHLEAATVVWDH